MGLGVGTGSGARAVSAAALPRVEGRGLLEMSCVDPRIAHLSVCLHVWYGPGLHHVCLGIAEVYHHTQLGTLDKPITPVLLSLNACRHAVSHSKLRIPMWIPFFQSAASVGQM